jgi:site-specific recombinase XerD
VLDSAVSKRTPNFGYNALSAHVDACLHKLIDQGYAKLTVDRYRCSLGHFSHWLARNKIAWSGHEDALVRRFLTTHLAACDCTGRYPHNRQNLSAALHHLLCFLRAHGHITARSPGASTIEEEVHRFDAYLEGICGLASKTRRARTDFVRRFLSQRFACGPIDLTGCSPRQIRQFVTEATQGWKRGSIAVLCGALRSYLRFRAICGERTDTLMAAVPSVAQWRTSSLPNALTEVEIERFLGAFDCTSTEGSRNYAMARCLVDLGLRAGEVARLQLEDINWRQGTLQLKCTKGKRIDMLPLPATTGQAIVQYLQRRLARRFNRALFVRQRPPLDAPLTVEIVSSAMRQAYARAGITKRWSGTHCLRHSLACHLVNAGTPLKEIADVLRHRSLNSTIIYAKVNVTQLAAVALPWPGRVS